MKNYLKKMYKIYYRKNFFLKIKCVGLLTTMAYALGFSKTSNDTFATFVLATKLPSDIQKVIFKKIREKEKSESIIKSIIVNNQILNTPPTYIKHLKYLHIHSDRFRREYDVNYLIELRMHNINARINRRLFD